jgi:hypothetical protein
MPCVDNLLLGQPSLGQDTWFLQTDDRLPFGHARNNPTISDSTWDSVFTSSREPTPLPWDNSSPDVRSWPPEDLLAFSQLPGYPDDVIPSSDQPMPLSSEDLPPNVRGGPPEPPLTFSRLPGHPYFHHPLEDPNWKAAFAPRLARMSSPHFRCPPLTGSASYAALATILEAPTDSAAA